MSNVPAARERILTLVETLEAEGRCDHAEELRTIEAMLHRKKYRQQRVEPNSTPIDAALRWQIYDYAMGHPEKSMQEIGNFFGVNPGRVSETLKMAGDRRA